MLEIIQEAQYAVKPPKSFKVGLRGLSINSKKRKKPTLPLVKALKTTIKTECGLNNDDNDELNRAINS